MRLRWVRQVAVVLRRENAEEDLSDEAEQGQEADGVEEEEALGEVEAEEEELVLGVELANVGNEVVLEAPDTEAGMEELLARISAALVVS